MSRIIFQPGLPVVRSAPNRADIACFIGFLSLRAGATIPNNVAAWLDGEALIRSPLSSDALERLQMGAPLAGQDIPLKDVPIPIDDWAVFDRLFAWDRRSGDAAGGATYMGCAVRSFFGQGGRKCYVISLGDPVVGDASREDRDRKLNELVPGYPLVLDPVRVSAAARANWSSVGHLFGLPDVSFLSLPDLPDLVCDPPKQIEQPPPPAAEEHFVECTPEIPPKPSPGSSTLAAPRCDDLGYQRWHKALGILQQLPTRDPLIQEMQFIAAVPIPDEQCAAATDMLSYLGAPNPLDLDAAKSGEHPQPILPAPGVDPQPRIGAFVQLTYPWLRTTGSTSLPEGLEPPDGALSGLLARNALTRGTFASGTKIPVTNVFDVSPQLRGAETKTPALPAPDSDHPLPSRTLVQRVSLFAPTPRGISLISDVTVHPDESFRQAPVNRLVEVIIRAARALGEAHVFDGNGERTWALVRLHLTELMTNLWAAGALNGDKAEQAFSVACDRNTMMQNDLDNGRMIASVSFTPVAMIETITVLLSLSAGDAGSNALVGVVGSEVA
jgi:hypothetical protein